MEYLNQDFYSILFAHSSNAPSGCSAIPLMWVYYFAK